MDGLISSIARMGTGREYLGGSGGVGVPCGGGVWCVEETEAGHAGVVETEGAVAEEAEGAGLDTAVENPDGNRRWRSCAPARLVIATCDRTIPVL